MPKYFYFIMAITFFYLHQVRYSVFYSKLLQDQVNLILNDDACPCHGYAIFIFILIMLICINKYLIQINKQNKSMHISSLGQQSLIGYIFIILISMVIAVAICNIVILSISIFLFIFSLFLKYQWANYKYYVKGFEPCHQLRLIIMAILQSFFQFIFNQYISHAERISNIFIQPQRYIYIQYIEISTIYRSKLNKNTKLFKTYNQLHLSQNILTHIKKMQNIPKHFSTRTTSLAVLLLMIIMIMPCALSIGVSPCPIQSNIGSLISARITVAQTQSLILLVQGTDTQCYNYSLPFQFSTVPQVAIAVHDFQARATNDLFFSIKPLHTESLVSIPFLVRTQWRYTFWNRISFSFIAEDRKDFESGYYQIDTGVLGGCDAGKNVQIIMPFRNIGLLYNTAGGLAINHAIFLHGFQISSQKYTADVMSPFQIQLAESYTNSSGITVLITTTTVTQVHSVYISYIAWIATKLNIVAGNYTYEPSTLTPNLELSHTPSTNIGRNYARIFGLTGVIINHNFQNITFATAWTGTKFVFNLGISQRLTQYFSFQYIFFIGSECGNCPGYEFVSNGVCVEACPPGSYPTIEKTCISCGDGFYWDGSGCIKLCPIGQTLNLANNQCQCPAGANWTGTVCINCTLGRVYNPNTKMCECPIGTRWNGFSCSKMDPCLNGKEWNVYTFNCECPPGTIWNGTFCLRRRVCLNGSYLNPQTNECLCPDGTIMMNGYCQSTGCIGGQIWNGAMCACQQGYNWNGSVCLLCINGQVWNQLTKLCLCQINFTWNGNFCERMPNCSGGRVYNKDYQVCVCPDGQTWNGATCIVRQPCCCGKQWNDTSLQCDCPSGFNWDGRTCVFCTNGKVWDPSTRQCICQTGTQWNNQFCAVIQNCQGGTIWNQNTWSCQCPSTTVWNNLYCMANPCIGGQIWDNFTKACICVGNKVFINNTCMPPQLTCTNGTVWDPLFMACRCPAGFWYNGTFCQLIQKCVNNQIYNPLINKCICPPGLVFLATKQICGDPTCPTNKRWNGFSCVELSCPPNSWFNGTQCVCPNPRDRCLPWELFDGEKCVYFQDTCPKGTRWDGKMCAPIGGQCPMGFYKQGTQCKPFPQRCIPPTVWDGNRCQSTGGNCPYGTVARANSCQSYSGCTNGQSWDGSLLQCVCPKGTGWSGRDCVVCAGGQIWSQYDGCTCPQGYFMAGSRCQRPAPNMCRLIPNAIWDNSRQLCLCQPGFSVVGYQCVCKQGGVQYENFCDRCAFRPNSKFYNGICRCNPGYTLYGTQCLPDIRDGNNTASDCNVATYFDTQQKKCLPCPDGCLQCSDCYTCIRCSIHFTMDPTAPLCIENCGDGKRYVKECDDGNNINGDGCSNDCKIQQGFTCRGGSPTTPDNCFTYVPTTITYLVIGQIRYSTKMVITVKIDYLPKRLLQSQDCNDRCSSVIQANVVQGDKPISTRSSYIAGSRYSFSIQMQFGKSYISRLKVEVKINPSLASYFTGVNISNTYSVDIVPSQLTLALNDKRDALS